MATIRCTRKLKNMAAFRCLENLRDMVARIRLENSLPTGGFKTCHDLRCVLCKYSSDTQTFNCLSQAVVTKYQCNLSCNTTISGQQLQGSPEEEKTRDLCRCINNHQSTIKTKKNWEPLEDHFNHDGHK